MKRYRFTGYWLHVIGPYWNTHYGHLDLWWRTRFRCALDLRDICNSRP